MDVNIKERWNFIKDFPNYIITEKGNVYSYRNNKTGYQGLRQLKTKGINNSKRYLQVCLCNNGFKKYIQIHTLVGLYFVNGYFKNAVINHKDADIHNNNYTNLEWVTQKENVNKSYITSGVDQFRNYNYWNIIHPNGEISPLLKGKSNIEKYIKDTNVNISISSLIKYKECKGYKLIKCKIAENLNDYSERKYI